MRTALRFYAWSLASWLADRLDPSSRINHPDPEEDELGTGPDDIPATLDEEGWAMLSTNSSAVTTSEPPAPIAGSFAARTREQP